MATKGINLTRCINISQTNDILQHVHIFHRHGDRTPWFPVTDEETERNLWTGKISNHYSFFNGVNNEQTVSNSQITTWDNISSKLRGSTLSFKNDNWNFFAPTIGNIQNINKNKWSEFRTNDQTNQPFLGQLTEKGCNELENVGKWLRNRYIDNLNYLPLTYNVTNTQLHYQSTNRARCIQSADSLLQQLYPMNNRINNALIPLFVDHPDDKYTFLNPGTLKNVCNKLQEKSEYNLNCIISTFNNDFYEYFESVLSYYSLNKDELHHYAQPDSAQDITFDAVICRMMHNISIPNNITNEYLIEFGKYCAQMHCAQMSLDRESLRISWGNVVYKMINSMNMIHENDKKFIICSCHDNSILAVLCTLYGDNIFKIDLEWPPYASFIVFEVWKNDVDKKYVRVLYNGQVLDIFDGKDYIYLDELNNKWKDIMIDDVSFCKYL